MKYQILQKLIKNTDKNILKSVVSDIDGHTIYDSKHFISKGLDPKIVEAFTKVQQSGENPKEIIYVL